jgi:hypothetical protein
MYSSVFSNAPYGGANNINFCNTPLDTTKQSFYGTGIGAFDSNTPLVASGIWYHLVYVYATNASYLYVNGSLVSVDKPQPNFTNSSDLLFGKYPLQSHPYWFNGALDDIRIYNRAINVNEVTALYHEDKPVVLPITLQSFTATLLTNGSAAVHFTTTHEVNAASIVVERSFDATTFSAIGKLAAWGKLGVNAYAFTDANLANTAIVYYRLKLVDKDGTYKYSNIISLSVNKLDSATWVAVYPNPLKAETIKLA